MKLVWDPSAWDEQGDWQSDDRKTLKRINTLIKDIQRGDSGGIGKPELIEGDLSGWESRRITEGHRLVYRTYDAKDELEILASRHHYGSATDGREPDGISPAGRHRIRRDRPSGRP